MAMSRHILGVRIDSLSPSEALIKASSFLSGTRSSKIFTPNPEMLVKAATDPYFKNVLNSGDLNICDGFGISLVSGFRIKRVTGVDFMRDISRLAEEKNYSVYLLGSGSQTVMQKAAANLQHQFPRLQIIGADPGPRITEATCHSERSEESLSQSSNGQRFFASLKMTNDNDEVIRDIQSKQPAILFVAFGMGKQEKWIHENLSKLPSVKVAMGVGGSFDYLSGRLRRSPRLMQVLGLEWLYRLFVQPQRIGRIFNATFKFLYYYYVRSKREKH
ncbi:MAG: WecB/TagA/CpsF family glycosyltransferase [Candidatus Magasanikbacteria bacterium]|nr:WecB/TagA/CpsF family glycosyltransferase [Candidatus Magasanikbacteria bacterium]